MRRPASSWSSASRSHRRMASSSPSSSSTLRSRDMGTLRGLNTRSPSNRRQRRGFLGRGKGEPSISCICTILAPVASRQVRPRRLKGSELSVELPCLPGREDGRFSMIVEGPSALRPGRFAEPRSERGLAVLPRGRHDPRQRSARLSRVSAVRRARGRPHEAVRHAERPVARLHAGRRWMPRRTRRRGSVPRIPPERRPGSRGPCRVDFRVRR